MTEEELSNENRGEGSFLYIDMSDAENIFELVNAKYFCIF